MANSSGSFFGAYRRQRNKIEIYEKGFLGQYGLALAGASICLLVFVAVRFGWLGAQFFGDSEDMKVVLTTIALCLVFFIYKLLTPRSKTVFDINKQVVRLNNIVKKLNGRG